MNEQKQGKGHRLVSRDSVDNFEVSPEDLHDPLVADHLAGALPPKVAFVNGRPVAPPTDGTPAVQIDTREAAVGKVLDRMREGFLVKEEEMVPALGQAIDLAFLMLGVDPELIKLPLPYNAEQVRPGGYSVIGAYRAVPAAKVMSVDTTALGKNLALEERIRRLRGVIDNAHGALEANQSQVLTRIAEQVDSGLNAGYSVIETNGMLKRKLEPALAIRGKPAAAAQATRAGNERLEANVRAEEQARHKSEQTTQAKATEGTTTTVTTQNPIPVPNTPPPRKKPE